MTHTAYAVPSRHETGLLVRNLDRGWVAEIMSPSAPRGGSTLAADDPRVLHNFRWRSETVGGFG